MGLEDVGDCHAEAPDGLKVDVHIRSRIYNSANMCSIISQQIGAFGHAIGKKLFKSQGHGGSSFDVSTKEKE